jgi:hypothetical protein
VLSELEEAAPWSAGRSDGLGSGELKLRVAEHGLVVSS